MMQGYFQIWYEIWVQSGFWHIQTAENERYKTAFTTPFGHYEWNVASFGLKNAPCKFQHIVNDMLNDYSKFSIVYIDDVLIYLKILDQLQASKNVFNVIKRNGLGVSFPKMKLFQTKIHFLGHDVFNGTIRRIQCSIDLQTDFHMKSMVKIIYKDLQIFFPKRREICKPLFQM